MENKLAYDFLLHYYFKITIDSNYDLVCNSAVKKAYEDTVRQGAFNAIVLQRDKELIPSIKTSAFEKMLKILKKHLKTGKFENDWHEKWCKEIVDIFEPIKSKKDTLAFTYGNAQKWVNMTLKNMYLIAIAFKFSKGNLDNGWYDVIINNAEHFHTPLDNYVLEAALLDFEAMENHIKVKSKKNKEYHIISDGKTYPWSQIPNYDTYAEFQNILTNEIKKKYSKNPIDWECEAWVKVAQGRK